MYPAPFILAALLVSLLAMGTSWGHPDIESQLEDLSRQILEAPDRPELYLRRGDLYRRHGDWGRAGQDFETARALEPTDTQVDWYQGHLYSESGQWDQGEVLLTQFLETHPEHAGAYQARAKVRWGMGDPHAAAQDYSRAIAVSRKPAPALYRSLVIAQIHTGEAGLDNAAASTDAGLAKFPFEVSLLGLGVDLALASTRTGQAKDFMNRLPAGTANLPQWKFRRALLFCLEGQTEGAASQLEALAAPGGASVTHHTGTWTVPTEKVLELAADPSAEACRSAAASALMGLQP